MMKFRKIAAFTAAVVLTVSAASVYGCVPSSVSALSSGNNMKKSSSSAEGVGTEPEYVVTLLENWDKYVIKPDGMDVWNELDDIYADCFVNDFVVPSVYMKNDWEGEQIALTLYNVRSGSVHLDGAENVYFSDGIFEIEDFAIDGDENLKSVSFGDSVRKIGNLTDSEDVIYRGHKGSFAEIFSKSGDIKFEYIGDVNNDGKINSADAMSLSGYLTGARELDDDAAQRADENLDAKISILDYIKLKSEIIYPRSSAMGASLEGALAVPDGEPQKSGRKTTSDDFDGFIGFASETASAVLLDTKDTKGEENTVYSPVSVFVALSMAAECAAGNTKAEILDVLSVDDTDDMKNECRMLMGELYLNKFDSYCRISNSMWLNGKYKFNQNTLDGIASDFYAPVFSKDFSDESAAGEITSWISDNTFGKYSPVITLNDEDLIKILNTVCFKGKWDSKFGDAVPDTFHLKNGEDIQCDFLKSFYSKSSVGFADNFMKHTIYMDDGYRMSFVLPDEGVSIDEIISDSEALEKIYTDDLDIRYVDVEFSLPEFKVESAYDLIETSKKLGINDAFDNVKGDFTNVINYEENHIPSACINQFIHEAKVQIDEEGCEAAAYTVISISVGCAPGEELKTVYFELDRPFYYYITNETGVPVFSGIINNPSAK